MNEDAKHYPVVGRSPEIDLTKYTVTMHGRDVIDYEKVKRDDPALYQKIIDHEHQLDHLDYNETEKPSS